MSHNDSNHSINIKLETGTHETRLKHILKLKTKKNRSKTHMPKSPGELNEQFVLIIFFSSYKVNKQNFV